MANSRDIVTLRCGGGECPNTFKTRPVRYNRRRELLAQAGWVHRGTREGWKYYCPEHNPDLAWDDRR